LPGAGGLVVPLNQGDPRWNDLVVGNSSAGPDKSGRSPHRFGLIGCVSTSATFAINTLTGQQLTPPEVVRRALPFFINGKTPSGPGVLMVLTTKSLSQFGVKCGEKVNSDDRNRTNDLPKLRAALDATLAAGGVALVRVDYDLTSPETNHTIACFAKAPDGYKCADPAGGVIITLDPSTLAVQRTKTKVYSVTGVLPVFRA
jgi:hypothetical protein